MSCKSEESSRLIFKDSFLKHQELSLLLCRELSENGRRQAWRNKMLLADLRQKKVSSGSMGELPSRNIETLPEHVVMELGNQKLIWN